MKHFILSFILSVFFLNATVSQNLYFKTETNTEGGMAVMSKMSKSTMEFYQKGSKSKSVTEAMKTTQEVISDVYRVTIMSNRSPKCAVLTKEELALDSLENDFKVTDVQVEKTDEIEKMLGYNCKKTIIRYKVEGYEYQNNIWCTNEIEVPKPDKKPMESTKRNALIAAMGQLDGFSLKTETIMSGVDIRTIAIVTEVNTKEINDWVFDIKPGRCEKPLNLKEYKAELLRQKIDAKRFSSNAGGGW